MNLTPESLRVLGSLMEKEMVTPDTYPLSLNALIAAANQRSSREPVTDLTEDEVRTALDALEARELVSPARDGGRVSKFEHRIRTVLTLRRDETAILCLLLLRGPQTPGELRSRSDRMFSFDDLPQLQSTLWSCNSHAAPAHAKPAGPICSATQFLKSPHFRTRSPGLTSPNWKASAKPLPPWINVSPISSSGSLNSPSNQLHPIISRSNRNPLNS